MCQKKTKMAAATRKDKNGRCDKKRSGGGGGALTNGEECDECDARGDLCEGAEWRRARGVLTSAHARLVRHMRRGVTNAARVTNAPAVWQMRQEASHEGLAGREETGRYGKSYRSRVCVSVSRGHGRDARALTLATGDVEMQKTIVLTRVATPLKTMPRRATRNFHSMSKTAAAPAKPSSRSASPSDCIKAQRATTARSGEAAQK